MQITVLCKVVDNFGDIGVVYRLSKRLKKLNQNNQINLIAVDYYPDTQFFASYQLDAIRNLTQSADEETQKKIFIR